DMGAGVSGGCGHQVGVLEEFAELRSRLHGAEESERVLRRHLAVFEEPLHVLPRHAGAGADEVFNKYAPGGIGVAELEGGEERGDGRIPGEAMLVDEPGEHEGG